MPQPQTITSAANPLLKDVRRAIGHGGLTDEGLCVAEGFHLLEEALRSECGLETVLAAESAKARVEAQVRSAPRVRIIVAPDALFQKIAGTETSQGVIALLRPRAWSLDELLRGRALVVALDGLQDPGNAGTIARTAEAFGATGLLFLKGSVSPFNPKTLRASAGSLFRIPFVHGIEPAAARTALLENGVDVYSAMPACPGAPPLALSDFDLTGPCALAIGSEGVGVGPEMRSSSIDISIPTVGVESLNAAVAAAILLYEASRQRAGAA